MTSAEPFWYEGMAALLGVGGLILVLAGWAAAKGRLKRNYVMGMRLRSIMRSDEAWRVAHKKCAWSIWSAGLVLLVSAVLLLLRPSETWTTSLLSVSMVIVLALVLVGAAQADKAARSIQG